MANPPDKNTSWRNWFKYFQYKEDRDSPSEVRNRLLVVVTLIAAVTFQAGVNPPGGVWQDNNGGHRAGRAIYASEKEAFYVFLISNTLALNFSLSHYVTHMEVPFQFEILVATVSMILTYGSAVFAVTPKESVRFRYVLFAAAVPFAMRCLVQMFKKVKSEVSK